MTKSVIQHPASGHKDSRQLCLTEAEYGRLRHTWFALEGFAAILNMPDQGNEELGLAGHVLKSICLDFFTLMSDDLRERAEEAFRENDEANQGSKGFSQDPEKTEAD